MIEQFEVVMWRGEPITKGQKQAIMAAEREIQKKYRNFEFQIPQGCKQAPSNVSGYTHTGLGVVDLQYAGFYGNVGYSTRAEKEKARFVLRRLRDVGCQAAQFRGPWNDMILHFHVNDLHTFGMHPDAVWQVGQYKLGENGLITGVRDRFPYRPDHYRKWRYRK